MEVMMLDSVHVAALWGVAAYHLMTICAGLALGAQRGRAAAGVVLAALFGPFGILMMMMMRDESQAADARRIREARALAAVETMAAKLSK